MKYDDTVFTGFPKTFLLEKSMEFNTSDVFEALSLYRQIFFLWDWKPTLAIIYGRYQLPHPTCIPSTQ